MLSLVIRDESKESKKGMSNEREKGCGTECEAE
jgi:hypothetical protein